MKRPPHEGICDPICHWCADVAAADISQLPRDWLDLKQDVARRYGLSETKIARPHFFGSEPLDLLVDELCSDIEWTLTVWEPPVREYARLGAEIVRAVRPGHAVQVAARVLSTHIRVLAGLPGTVGYADGLAAGPVLRTGREGVERLRALHAHAAGRLGLRRGVFQLPGDCSGCGGESTLRRFDGGDTVWCDVCRRRWTYGDYCRYVNLTIATLGGT